MKKFTVIIIALLLAGIAHAETRTLTATVTKVVDGDTIAVKIDGKKDKVRLACIDAPERKQPYGARATELVRMLAERGSVVTVESRGRGRYRRIIGKVITADGFDLGRVLVTFGLAWARCDDLRPLQDAARASGKGLWGGPKPIDPKSWRKGVRP